MRHRHATHVSTYRADVSRSNFVPGIEKQDSIKAIAVRQNCNCCAVSRQGVQDIPVEAPLASAERAHRKGASHGRLNTRVLRSPPGNQRALSTKHTTMDTVAVDRKSDKSENVQGTETVAARWSVEVLHAQCTGTRNVSVPGTWTEAFAVFCLHPTPIITALGICSLFTYRMQSAWSMVDAAAFAAGAVAWVAQEWYIHAKLFHGDVDWFGKRIHTGHHQTPYYHITIDAPQIVVGAMALSLAVFCVTMGTALGQSAALAYWCMGLLYVFSHYAVHTRAVPRSRLGRRVRQHHMQHHCRNENYWLSFCVPEMDTIMGTNPVAGSVPMTDMARAAVQKRK